MNNPEGIVVEIWKTVKVADWLEDKEEALTILYKVRMPSAAALRDENDCLRKLVVLIYFQIRKHFLERAYQFKTASHYTINQKLAFRSCSCQKISQEEAKSTKDDPEIIKDDNDTEKEGKN